MRSGIGVDGLLPRCARPVDGPLGRPARLRRGRRLRRLSAHLPPSVVPAMIRSLARAPAPAPLARRCRGVPAWVTWRPSLAHRTLARANGGRLRASSRSSGVGPRCSAPVVGEVA